MYTFMYVGWVGAVQAYRYAPRPEKSIQKEKSSFSIQDHFTRRNYQRKSTQQSPLDKSLTSSVDDVSDIPFTSKEEQKMESFRMSILAVNSKEALKQLDEKKAQFDRMRQERYDFQPSRYTNEKYNQKKAPKAEGEGGGDDENKDSSGEQQTGEGEAATGGANTNSNKEAETDK